MSSPVVRRQKFRKVPLQPIDRHLAEITDSDGSIYINAGIDSTCCKKRGRTIHQLTDGIMIPSPQIQIAIQRVSNRTCDDFSSELNIDGFNDERVDVIDTQSCSYCGK